MAWYKCTVHIIEDQMHGPTLLASPCMGDPGSLGPILEAFVSLGICIGRVCHSPGTEAWGLSVVTQASLRQLRLRLRFGLPTVSISVSSLEVCDGSSGGVLCQSPTTKECTPPVLSHLERGPLRGLSHKRTYFKVSKFRTFLKNSF